MSGGEEEVGEGEEEGEGESGEDGEKEGGDGEKKRKRKRRGWCVCALPNLSLQRVCVVNHLFILHVCVYIASTSMCIHCIYMYVYVYNVFLCHVSG